MTLAGSHKILLSVNGTGVDSNKLVKKLKKVGEAKIVELWTQDTFEEGVTLLSPPVALPIAMGMPRMHSVTAAS